MVANGAEEIDFASIIDECVKELEFIENAMGIQIQYKIDLKQALRKDRLMLKVIFLHIISNSIRYQRRDIPERRLDINITEEDQQVRILFKDNGMGIPPEHKPKVFDMFYRGSEIGMGTGVGLYIVKQAIKHFNAEIELDSRVNEGTEVLIRMSR